MPVTVTFSKKLFFIISTGRLHIKEIMDSCNYIWIKSCIFIQLNLSTKLC